jgi:hypothetical protein
MLNQKVRYGLVRRLVRRHRSGAICEVGSGRTGLARYFRGVRFVGVDVDFEDYGAEPSPLAAEMTGIRADARRLPFRDASFDLVFSLDMVEHLAVRDRPVVIRELARVARHDLVVAFPCGDAARDADRRQAHALAARGRPVPGWLAEHVAIEYPMPAEMDAIFAALGHGFDVSGNETRLLRRLVRAAEWTGRPERLVDRFLPFGALDLVDRLGGARTRRAYHVRMG